MLVLSREHNESILIGDLDQDIVLRAGEFIRITVVDLRGNKVRLGVDARRDIQVHRSEIVDRIMYERRRDARQANTEGQS